MKNLTDSNFESEVLKSTGLVLVDFYADWCQPCKMLAPTLEKLEKEFAGTVTFTKVDIDENNTVTGAQGVNSLPTLILYKDGKVLSRKSGLMNEKALKEFLKV
jgi:thioredoxin 1